MRRFGQGVVVVLGAISLVACADDSPTIPTGPTATAPVAVAAAPSSQTIEGTIEGTAAPDIIVVSGSRIKLNADATLRSGALAVKFADLSVGAHARVTAESSGGDLQGSLVEVLDPVGKPEFQHGMVESFSDNGTSFEFRFGSQLIRGDSATQVMDVTGRVAPSMLHNTVSIDVNGLLRTDYLYATRIGMDSTKSK